MRSPASRTWLLVVSIVVVGCSKASPPPSDTASLAKSPLDTARNRLQVNPDPTAVDNLAKSYSYGPERDAIATSKDLVTPHNQGVQKGVKPKTITIATASHTGAETDPEIIARITAERAYPGLGIGNKKNYLVRFKHNSTDPLKWDVWLVSLSPPGTVHLTRGTDPFSTGMPEEPRLVFNEFETKVGARTEDMIAYGVCIDDPNLCTTGHCGYNYQ